MNAVAVRMIVKAHELVKGDVILGISAYESFVVAEDVKDAHRCLGAWVVDVQGDTEDGDVFRERGELEELMVLADDEIEIIRGAI